MSTLLMPQRIAIPRAVVGALSLLCPLAAWGWLSLSPRQDLSLTLGCLLAGMWLARMVMSHVRARQVPVRDPVLAPFL